MTDYPRFKSQQDCETYTGMFTERTEKYIKFMEIVRDRLYSGFTYDWSAIDGRTIESIENITRNLLYSTSTDFKESYPEYKTDEDDIFIPYRSFKENITEALKEVMPSALEKSNDEGLLGGK